MEKVPGGFKGLQVMHYDNNFEGETDYKQIFDRYFFDKKMATVLESDMANYLVRSERYTKNGKPILHIIKEPIMPSFESFKVVHGLGWLPRFNKILRKVNEAGLIDWWAKKIMYKATVQGKLNPENCEETTKFEPLSIYSVFWYFVCLAFGLVTPFVVFLAELYVGRNKRFKILFASTFAQVTLPNQPIKDALYLHNSVSSNLTLRDCVFRPANAKDMCPDPDVEFILYGGGKRQLTDYTQSDWLRQSVWDPQKEDIFLIHGYAGGGRPYAHDGIERRYNVWIVDWGNLCPPPCYRAAVHNMRAVAKCTGDFISSLRVAGLQTEKLTCIGHSLGAHGTPSGDAGAVHVFFIRMQVIMVKQGRAGHVDFCINGGRIHQFCENAKNGMHHDLTVFKINDHHFVQHTRAQLVIKDVA
ncbi:hypothetical protein NQ317_019647 [Molorchus minor]|uniref:Lipase domain-containing protein n=1 Tax=Molorchus minor TaxID=1323400 RepID=A0ABQ9IV51_9CUCU|nr:hypothetical protein NQ317_019647 [Molorchus minor]